MIDRKPRCVNRLAGGWAASLFHSRFLSSEWWAGRQLRGRGLRLCLGLCDGGVQNGERTSTDSADGAQRRPESDRRVSLRSTTAKSAKNAKARRLATKARSGMKRTAGSLLRYVSGPHGDDADGSGPDAEEAEKQRPECEEANPRSGLAVRSEEVVALDSAPGADRPQRWL